MFSRRQVLLGGTAIATVAAAGTAFAVRALSSGRSPPGEEVVAWLRANAIPLASTEPGSGDQDLEALHRVVGRARIVSLGEATHGTREFIQLRHRLIEYCVSKLGFTMIGLEAAFGEERAINEYVLTGKGSAVDALRSMTFFIWQYEEMVAIVEWVRAWNAANERKVVFYDFDMQTAGGASGRLLDYLKPLAPELAAVVETSLTPDVFDRFLSLSSSTQDEILVQIRRILSQFDSERAPWTSRSSELEWRLARLSAVVLEQCAHLNRMKEPNERNIFRDRCMADNVSALLEAHGPAVRALLLAHNGHVMRSPSRADPAIGRTSRPIMGSYLHSKFGAEQVVVGFSFNQGRFIATDAGKLREHVVGPAPQHMLDAVFAATGVPLLALALNRVPPDGPVARWMASCPYQRDIGGAFSSEANEHLLSLGMTPYMMSADPRDLYDILLFVESTTAPVPLGCARS